jgi:hypothetical protein
MPVIKGFHVCIIVGDTVLDEYAGPEDECSEVGIEPTRIVEALPGTRFGIKVIFPPPGTYDWQASHGVGIEIR